ncbi:MAG TPA: type VI secretion system baseplate subunit TssE [Bryobacteraceae bacterium]|nr:type VI secretion system baseplate subunit TssE [Bryobacteraceae bacterium]
MARGQIDAAVTLSVLDRLIDQDPRSSSEAPLQRAQAVRQLKNAVKRDLEWLLNNRRIADEPPEALREVSRSLYTYGLPDFSAYNIGSDRDKTRLVRVLQASIKLFEPRLANVRVVPVEVTSTGARKVRFRIEGLLLMDPAPEHVSFDTVLQLNNGEYQVKGEADAG